MSYGAKVAGTGHKLLLLELDEPQRLADFEPGMAVIMDRDCDLARDDEGYPQVACGTFMGLEPIGQAGLRTRIRVAWRAVKRAARCVVEVALPPRRMGVEHGKPHE